MSEKNILASKDKPRNCHSIDDLMLKDAIRLAIGSWLYDGGNIIKVPELLKELRVDYTFWLEELNKKQWVE